MKFSFLTLFPELISPYFNHSILARAKQAGLINTEFINPRNFSKHQNKQVDEYMISGGPGLLLMPEPLDGALKHILAKNKNTHFVFLTPVGKVFKQNDAKRLAKKEHICFVCGRYEGFDERILEKWANEAFSVGDFVLTGGELAALCMSDAISRNLTGVLGNNESLEIESFENLMLEAPSFTKPNDFENRPVVSDFLKGNHAIIRFLKKTMALCKTRYFRPDLYQQLDATIKENYEK